MAHHRGIVNGRSLKELCQGYYLPTPVSIRGGTVFASKNGSLSAAELNYCQLDVEAPLILHSIYSEMPDLTARLLINEIKEGMKVDVMPYSKSSTIPID